MRLSGITRHKKRIIILIVGIFFIIFCLLFLTSWGAGILLKLTIARSVGARRVTIENTQGNLLTGVVFNDIEGVGFKNLPEDTSLRIQQVNISHSPANYFRINLQVQNGRIEIPAVGLVLFYGDYNEGALDFNIYSKSVNLTSVVGLFKAIRTKELREAQGVLEDLDIQIKGPLGKPHSSGAFLVKEAAFREFLITNLMTDFDLFVNKGLLGWQLNGDIDFKEGLFSCKNTRIEIGEGRVSFSGKASQPHFDISGSSLIGKTKIFISLKGTLDKPDLNLNSHPPMDKEVLMVMLFTGFPVEGIGKSLSSGQLSPDLVTDFVDYFILGGAGHKAADALGIEDILFQYDQQGKGVEVKKSVTDSTSIIYGVKQKELENQDTSVSQDVGLEQKITEKISVQGKTKIEQEAEKKTDEEKNSLPESEVDIKFEHKF